MEYIRRHIEIVRKGEKWLVDTKSSKKNFICLWLFIEKGYQKTTTVGNFKKAGVTPSTFIIFIIRKEYFGNLQKFMFGNQFNIPGR